MEEAVDRLLDRHDDDDDDDKFLPHSFQLITHYQCRLSFNGIQPVQINSK